MLLSSFAWSNENSHADVNAQVMTTIKNAGGWLKGLWRKNPETGTYQCRKIYILPIQGNYFIGSWYHYPSDQEGKCSI